MKKINKLLLLIALFFLIPTVALAASGSSGEEDPSGPIKPCTPNCSGIQRSSSLAGVRITFVDENGVAVAASNGLSFDFETYIKPGKEGLKTHYNNYAGDRNKITLAGGGNFSLGVTNQSDIKKFSAVAAAYNKYAPLEGSSHLTSLKQSGNTGGNLNAGFSSELAFFLSITKKGNPTYAADVNAFIRAIAEVSGGFNADDLIYKVKEGCSSGEQIFIIMEPIFFWSGKVGGTYENYFGTLADSYHFFDGKIIGALSNTNNMAYAIYYEKELEAFKGAVGVSSKGYKIQTGADLLSNVGFSMALDWASDPGEYCATCSYQNGKFSYDNKIYPGDLVIPSKYSSISEYAFSKREEGGAGCCEILKDQISTMPAEWQESYNKLCNDEGPDCCTPSVEKKPEINVNNCCSDNAESYVKEAELDDLFCYDNELQVDYYKNRCDNDSFKEKLNDYCDIYCTERVTMEVPGAITATSGRYFTLTKTSHGTTSPYIDGYRRCRVKIYYNEWRDNYVDKVKKEIQEYNEFQRQASMEKNYEAAIPTEETISKSGTVTASCSSYDPTTKQTKTNTASASFSYTFYRYTFENKHEYYTVALKDDHYSRVEIVNGSKLKEPHEPYSLFRYEEAMAAYEAAKSSAASACGLGNVTYSGDSFDTQSISYRSEDPKSVINTIRQAKNNAKAAYEVATKDAYTLEQKIDECDYYFDDTKSRLEEKGSYDGKNAETNYAFTPDVLFRYSQAYLDDSNQKAFDILSVEFDRTCTYETIYDANETGVDEIKPDRYSGLYQNGHERMHDFDKDTQLEYETGFNLNKYYDYEYKAEKKFTTDAKYHANCTWTEKDHQTYTLVPSGLSSETEVYNHTVHNREYKIYLTTFDGTYETYWDINNIGHKGAFTEYFKQGGTTCANENPNDIGTTITCKIHVEHELVLTGKCNGSNGTDTTISEEDCEPVREGFDLFAFKIADPANLFPTGTDTESGKIAYNWTDTERGQEVKKEIEEKALTASTYAPENITYQLTFTPTDMRQIKNYNRAVESDNGYSDFNMHCECPAEEQTNSLENGVGCTKCKSYFLEDIEKGKVKYDGTEHNVHVWTSNKSLQEIRETLTAKGRW